MLMFLAQRFGSYPVALWLTLWLTFMTAAALVIAWCVVRAGTPTVVQVFSWALLLRIITLWGTPYFEDDYFRYLWDGYRTLVDGNPYPYAPSHFFSSAADTLPPKIAAALSALNNPDINTIYGPALQWLFALAALVSPGELWPIRALWLTVDMALVCVLIKHVGTTRAMLYAMCPLVLHEIGVAAHPDGLIGALIFFAFVAIKKERAILAAVFIGCAAAMKIHALLALPFLLTGLSTRSFTIVSRALVAGAAAYVFFWLPFIFTDGAFEQAWRSLLTFARHWQFNALGFAFVQMLIGTSAARIGCALLLLVLWALMARWAWRKQTSNASALVMAFGALLFFSPVINPWYLLWLLPIATTTATATTTPTGQRQPWVSPWVSPWVASIALPLSYATDFNRGLSSVPYTLPTSIFLLESILIAAALGFDLWRNSQRKAKP